MEPAAVGPVAGTYGSPSSRFESQPVAVQPPTGIQAEQSDAGF